MTFVFADSFRASTTAMGEASGITRDNADSTDQATLSSRIRLSEGRISGVAVNPVAPYIAAFSQSSGKISLFDLSRQRTLWEVNAFSELRGHSATSVQHVATFSSDGSLLAVGRTNQRDIVVIRSNDGTIEARIHDASSQNPGVLGLQFSEDDRLLIGSIWREKSVAVWDTREGHEVSRVKEERLLGSIFSPDPPFAFAVLTGSTQIAHVDRRGTKVWDYQSKTVRNIYPAPRLDPFADRATIRAASITPDGRFSILFLRTPRGDSANEHGLAVQNNQSGKIVAKTTINLPGDQFAFLSCNYDQLSVRGFAAGCFFSWDLSTPSKPAEIKCANEPWLPDDYAWPAEVPFQGYVSPAFDLAYSIVDNHSLGVWRLK